MLPVRQRRSGALTRIFEPISDWDLFEDLDRVFDRFFGPNAGGYYPADIWEDDENVYVEMEIPGVDVGDINVSFEGSILRIEGEKKAPEREGQTHLSERRYGRFVRAFHLPNVIDPENIKATCNKGVLVVKCAKKPEKKPKKIEVKVED